MKRSMVATLLSAFILTLLVACGGGTDSTAPPTTQTRPFAMGFTPWLYEASISAMDTTYSRLQQHGDIVKHHLMEGIPWPEALALTAYDPSVEADINNRVNRTPANSQVFLAIDSLNTGRNALSPYWADAPNLPLPGVWATKTWSDPDVISAYINFSLDMISRFNPTYFEYGTEVSELILNDPAGYAEYLVFAQAVYTAIKSAYPNLKLMVSVAMKSPGSAEMLAINSALPQLDGYVDVYGISTYPYIFFNHSGRGDPANLPANWLSQALDFAGSKPLAISETGWIGEDLAIPTYSYAEMSDQGKQDAYLDLLMTEAEKMNMEFVIWWTVADFDTLWNNELEQDPLAKIWKDIGLYDGNQQPRMALTRWDRWLARRYQP